MAQPPKLAVSHLKTQLIEKAGSPRNLPKHCGEHANPTKPQKGRSRWRNPPKVAASHLKIQLKRRDPQEIPQNTAGIGGKSFKPNQNLKKCRNRWCDGAIPSLEIFQRFCMVASGSNI